MISYKKLLYMIFLLSTILLLIFYPSEYAIWLFYARANLKLVCEIVGHYWVSLWNKIRNKKTLWNCNCNFGHFDAYIIYEKCRSKTSRCINIRHMHIRQTLQKHTYKIFKHKMQDIYKSNILISYKILPYKIEFISSTRVL